MKMKPEIERVTSAFLRQFNGFYQKFYFLNSDTIYYLFKTYTTSFYGSNVWIEQDLSDNLLRKLSVVYHNAVKRVAGMAPWNSNHLACEKVGVNIFRHLITKRLLNFYHSLMLSKNRIFESLKYYFMFNSELKNRVSNRFRDIYGVENLGQNDKNALLARVDYIERTEPRSYYNFNTTDVNG